MTVKEARDDLRATLNSGEKSSDSSDSDGSSIGAKLVSNKSAKLRKLRKKAKVMEKSASAVPESFDGDSVGKRWPEMKAQSLGAIPKRPARKVDQPQPLMALPMEAGGRGSPVGSPKHGGAASSGYDCAE